MSYVNDIDVNNIDNMSAGAKITDAHAHIYPDKISVKATEGVANFYDFSEMRHIGSAKELLSSGGAAGVSRYWVYSVATSPSQVRSINSFIAGQCALHPEFVGFGAIHPDVEDMESEIQNIIDLGLKGVKIHPDFQRFYLDEPRAMRIYEVIEGRLPIVAHTGDYRYDFSAPSRLAKALREFPRLTAIAAHFGGWSVWEEAYEALHNTNCWVDTCSTFGFLKDPAAGRRLIDMWGADRILWGVDFPMWDHGEELELLRGMNLSAEDMEKILWKNAETVVPSE